MVWPNLKNGGSAGAAIESLCLSLLFVCSWYLTRNAFFLFILRPFAGLFDGAVSLLKFGCPSSRQPMMFMSGLEPSIFRSKVRPATSTPRQARAYDRYFVITFRMLEILEIKVSLPEGFLKWKVCYYDFFSNSLTTHTATYPGFTRFSCHLFLPLCHFISFLYCCCNSIPILLSRDNQMRLVPTKWNLSIEMHFSIFYCFGLEWIGNEIMVRRKRKLNRSFTFFSKLRLAWSFACNGHPLVPTNAEINFEERMSFAELYPGQWRSSLHLIFIICCTFLRLSSPSSFSFSYLTRCT